MKQLSLVIKVLLVLTSINAEAIDTSYLIINPTHPNSGLPFNHSGSDFHGVCRALGYEHTALMTASFKEDDGLIADEYGDIVGGKRGPTVLKLVCTNHIPSPNDR